MVVAAPATQYLPSVYVSTLKYYNTPPPPSISLEIFLKCKHHFSKTFILLEYSDESRGQLSYDLSSLILGKSKLRMQFS